MDFRDLAGHVIRRLHQNATQVFQARLTAAGQDLTPVQYAALDAIRGAPGMDQVRLSALIACDRATLSGVVERLCKKGYIHRSTSATDRRARVLTLTPEGAALVAKLAPIVVAAQAEILPGLTPDERAQFLALAQKSAAAVGAEV
ncbi:MarR family winged helix-turn-helix transcriptional regulator [Arenibacterium sp. LLYu02]|uniref:MarR family winged helix-turn-helix transcriptional regulator n=1 Tax=Arenibacterium sp. LLYu02 TaxID=3404132 RepID=UPI003B214E61